MNRVSSVMGRGRERFMVILLVLALVLLFPLQASAASTAEFSPTLRKAYDKVVAASSGSVYDGLRSQDELLQSLRAQEPDLDGAILGLHRTNEELLLSIKARSKNLHKDKLADLQKEVDAAKNRYKVVYALQSSLSKQLSAAKKLKNKALTSSLELQLDAAKAAVLIARMDRETKEDRYSKAKADKSKKLKDLRARLEEADKLKVRIQASKSAAVQTGKQITSGLKSLASTAKKGDAGKTLSSASSLAAYSSKLLDQKRTVLDLEQKNRTSLEETLNWLSAE